MKEEDNGEFGFTWKKHSQFIHRPLGLQNWSVRNVVTLSQDAKREAQVYSTLHEIGK